MVMHKEQERYLQKEVLGTRILNQARNELYLHMRFLDLALGSFPVRPGAEVHPAGTDGGTLFFAPDDLLKLYQTGRVYVMRLYLHGLMHCLFCHPFYRKERDMEYWNLACDIAAESVIDGLYLSCVHRQPSFYRQDWYGRLRKELTVLNAQGVYHVLQKMELSDTQKERLAAEFYVDDHGYWKLPGEEPRTSAVRQNQWNKNRDRLQTEMETLGNQQEDDSKSLLEHVQVENRERYDYRKFLRKFSVLKEEMQVDPDSFDYVFYTYGMSLYGNMPLVEPLETKEISRIEDFVIVIDTSMSCSGELTRRFLEETYDVLCESDSYFRKVNIHIIQCDEQVRQDARITCREEMEAYMKDFTVIGQGGTDFRPAFEYVDQMQGRGEFSHLRGLLYFTDGEGIYPVKRRAYDTAFVFVKDQYTDISVPAWAMKVILEPEQLMCQRKGGDSRVQ